MSDMEWEDGDCSKVRAFFTHLLRSHVTYQDGRHSEAPTLIFADADYEAGDGTCGIHEDGKQANEPAIIYARADALIDAADTIERLTAERDEALEDLQSGQGQIAEAQTAIEQQDAAIRQARENALREAASLVGVDFFDRATTAPAAEHAAQIEEAILALIDKEPSDGS